MNKKEYSLEKNKSGETVLIEYCGGEEEVVVPRKVKVIGDEAFKYSEKSNIKSIVLPKGLRRIGASAFDGLNNLTQIELSRELTEIDSYSFCSCKKLRSITLPNNLRRIGQSAFQGCECLENIIIPASVTEIGEEAFAYCENLKSIEVDEGNRLYASVDGVLYDKNLSTLLMYPPGKKQDIFSVPEGVTAIGENAFKYLNRPAVVYLPDSLLLIEQNAFEYNSGIVKLNIPDSVTKIGRGAFSNCAKLKNLVLSKNISVVPQGMIYKCESLRELTVPDGVTKIESTAFYVCASLERVTIPKSVVDISSNNFKKCPALKEIIVDAENPAYCSVDGVLFSKDRTKMIHKPQGKHERVCVVPDGVEEIGFRFLGDKSDIERVVLPESVSRICQSAFLDCKALKKVELPYGLESIGDYAFSCSGIESLVIPDSVCLIGNYAFYGCKALKSVTFEGAPLIGESAFANCFALESVTFKRRLKEIGSSAFYWCESLTSVVFPLNKRQSGDAMQIKSDAFYCCGSLKEITLPMTKKIDDCGLGFGENGKMEGFIVRGFKSSAAEQYAKKYGFNFEEIE